MEYQSFPKVQVSLGSAQLAKVQFLGDYPIVELLRLYFQQAYSLVIDTCDSEEWNCRLAVDLSSVYELALAEAQYVIEIEVQDKNILVSPLLGSPRICPVCWKLRRMAAWATGYHSLSSDETPNSLLEAFCAAVSPQRHVWTLDQVAVTISLLGKRLQEALSSVEGCSAANTLHAVSPTGEVTSQTIFPRPDCTTCCPGPYYRQREMKSLEEVADVIIGPVVGMITKLHDVPALVSEPKFPVVVLATLANTWFSVGKVSGVEASGKGATTRYAVQSALGEAIERYSASFVPAPLIISCRHEFADCITPTELYGYTHDQAADLKYTKGEDQPTAWTKAFSITYPTRPVYVPASAVYTRLSSSTPAMLAGPLTTNGLACGPTIESAVNSALGEVLERDAYFRAWYGLPVGWEILLDSINSETLVSAIQEFAHHNLDVRLVHVGVNCSNVHVVAASCSDASRGPTRPNSVVGLGHGSSALDACIAAFLEMGQVYRGLTYALNDLTVRKRAEYIAINPLAIRSSFDHALYHAVTIADNSTIPLRTERVATLTACEHRVSVPTCELRDGVFVDLTPCDIANISSLRVARVLIPNTIPYHVGPRQIPLEMLNLQSISDLRPETRVHPLC